jgi:hypothetical protein
MSGADLLPNLAQPTIATPGWLAHRTLSGAYRTVRCPLPTIGAGHVSPDDFAANSCAVDRWLTGQSGAPRDSPMNFSRTPLNFSRERRLRRGRLTGQSGEPPNSPVNYSRTLSSSSESGRFTLDSSGAPDTVRCTTGQSGAPPDSPVNFSRTSLNFSQERRLRRGRLTGQSDAPPDSPVNYSCTPPSSPESGRFTLDSSGAPDTVRCTTGQSGAPRPSSSWLYTTNSFPIYFLLFLALRHNTLVPKSKY